MYFALADKYNNIVTNDNGSKLTVRIDATKIVDNSSYTDSYPPTIEGTTQFSSFGGSFSVSNIAFTGAPGYDYRIVFETDGIDSTKPSNLAY